VSPVTRSCDRKAATPLRHQDLALTSLSSALGPIRTIRSVGRFTEMVMTEGKGSYIKTECGRTILDFTCGSAFLPTGAPTR